jgi:hypothetical protein
MSKKISLDRTNSEKYSELFRKKVANIQWPPVEGTIPLVKDALIDVLGSEAKDLIKPQLDQISTSINSVKIMLMIADLSINVNLAATPLDYYTDASAKVFSQIKEELPDLLGQEDPSAWGWL